MSDTTSTTREQLAEAEVGQTEITSGTAWVLIGGFFAVILAVPMIQHVHEFVEADRSFPQPYDVVGALADFDVESLDRFESELEERAAVRSWILPPIQQMLTKTLGAGNEKAYLGREGWLFYRDDVDLVTGKPFLDPEMMVRKERKRSDWSTDSLSAILKFHEDLRVRGIRLVVMPTPSKTSIYPEKFSSAYDGFHGPLQNRSFQKFLSALRDAGVGVCDPTKAFMAVKAVGGHSCYLESDTHWTPEGMAIAVAELEKTIHQSNVRLNQQGTVTYRLKKQNVENLGDIARMLQLPALQTFYGPQRVQIHEILEADGSAWSADSNAEVLVLGDSFSNIYSGEDLGWGAGAGLVEQLSHRLGMGIDRIIRNDDGAFATRQELQADKGRLADKKLVIWQFAARELAIGNWKRLELPELSDDIGRPVWRPGLTVQGEIVAITPVPRPGTVPYRNALVSIHLTNLEAFNGEKMTREVVVFMWGMRDNKWTDAATFKPGEKLKLKLEVWETAKQRYGRRKRLELPDPDFELIRLPTYWAEITP